MCNSIWGGWLVDGRLKYSSERKAKQGVKANCLFDRISTVAFSLMRPLQRQCRDTTSTAGEIAIQLILSHSTFQTITPSGFTRTPFSWEDREKVRAWYNTDTVSALGATFILINNTADRGNLIDFMHGHCQKSGRAEVVWVRPFQLQLCKYGDAAFIRWGFNTSNPAVATASWGISSRTILSLNNYSTLYIIYRCNLLIVLVRPAFHSPLLPTPFHWWHPLMLFRA